MFILMPFVSSHGGWVEKYREPDADPSDSGREISLCVGWRMPFDMQHPATHMVWYSGSFSKIDRNFNENETALWRVQTCDFDDNMWEWFLSAVMKKRWNLHECRYVEDPNDVINNNPHLDNKFQIPISVLDHLVSTGLIKTENMKRLIQTRKKMEEEDGLVTHTIKEQQELSDFVQEKKKEKAKLKVSEVESLLSGKKAKTTV